MKKYRLLAFVIAALALCTWFSTALAMPPHPDLANRIADGALAVPYALEHEQEARQAGIEAPYQIPYMRDLARRHALDDNFKIIAILLDFSNRPGNVAATSFDNLLYGGQAGSLNDYISEITYGNITLLTVNMPSALGWLRAPQTYAYYVNGNNGWGSYPQNCQKMTEDAIALADPFVDFSQYDNDQDGYVDALFLIHAGPGAEFTGSSNDVWSHAWSTNSPRPVDGV